MTDKEKPMWKKEWVRIMAANVVVHVLSLILQNATNMDLEAKWVQVIVAVLSGVRYLTKTWQDGKNIEAAVDKTRAAIYAAEDAAELKDAVQP